MTQPPPQADEQVQQVAAVLATYVAADLTANAIAKLLMLPVAPVLAAVHLANRGTRPIPRAAGGAASKQAQLEELFYRSAYILAAARRISRSIAAGSSLEEAVAAEKTYQAAHESARKARLKAAAEIDQAAADHGQPTDDGRASWLGWYLSGNVNTHTVACEHADGRNFRTDRRPKIGWPGTVHYGCFPAGTLVDGPPVQAATLRWYSGVLVEIRTERGHVLAGTPNHPVLTPQGWVALDRLDCGTHVVSRRTGERFASVGVDEDQQVTRIEDAARALWMTPDMRTMRMPVSAEDFHGDGSVGEVHVVGTDRALREWFEVTGPFDQQQLVRADDPATLLASLRGGFHLGRSFHPTGGGEMSSAGPRRALLRGALGVLDPSGVDTATQVDVAPEPPSHERSADPGSFGELFDTLPTSVVADKIVDVRRFWFNGHVHNLTTADGWFTANAIVVHNCSCYAGPPHLTTVTVDQATASYIRSGGKP